MTVTFDQDRLEQLREQFRAAARALAESADQMVPGAENDAIWGDVDAVTDALFGRTTAEARADAVADELRGAETRRRDDIPTLLNRISRRAEIVARWVETVHPGQKSFGFVPFPANEAVALLQTSVDDLARIVRARLSGEGPPC